MRTLDATTPSRAQATCGSRSSRLRRADVRAREWYLNEKDLVARADLDAVQPELRALGEDLTAAVARVGALLGLET